MSTPTPPKEPPDGRVRLSKSQKAAAVQRVREGEKLAQVAADCGVSEKTIQRLMQKDKKEQAERRQRAAQAKKAKSLGELGIVHGDFRKAGNVVSDESADLVFTDPPYGRATLPQYKDLGTFAFRVLKPGGSLITYLGDYLLPDVLSLVTESGLRFWWPLVCIHTGATTNMKQWGVIVRSKLMLWFVKGKGRATKNFVASAIESKREKDQHDWQQGVVEARYYIEHLTTKGGLVVDPYCGGGTTCVAAKQLRRQYIAFEVKKETALQTRKRLHDTNV